MIKKVLFIIVMIITNFSLVQGQVKQGDIAAGGQLMYGTGVQMVGFGPHASYVFVANLRGELSINYFFEGNWDVNLNAEYLLNIHRKKLYAYPLIGLCLANLDTNIDDPNEVRSRKFGFNLGLGAQYRVAHDVDIYIEARRTVMADIHQTVIGAGATLTF